jgi:hypothetical protein
MAYRIPVFGAIPIVIRNTFEGAFDTTVGFFRSSCEDAGLEQMHQGLIKIREIPITIIETIFHLNYWYNDEYTTHDTLGTTIAKFFDEKIMNTSELGKRTYVLLAMVPLLIGRLIDAVIGVIALPFALIAGWGMSETLNRLTFSHLRSAFCIIHDTPLGFMKIFRPDGSYFNKNYAKYYLQ